MPVVARHLTISGRVQGVFYRQWTANTAHELGLDGWVRNRSDGTVEAVVSGPDAAVDTMIEACRHGPIKAHVTGVVVDDWQEPVEAGFQKRSTV